MSQLRQYNKRPCRTISYKLNVRQSIGAIERVTVDHERGRFQKQARTGRVFAFVPDVHYACCKTKKCARHFTDAKAAAIEKARKPLYDKCMDRETLRVKLKDNWQIHLRLPDGSKCCKKMALKIYNCSSSLLYGNQKRKREDLTEPQSQADANSKRTKIATSIASWFSLLKDTVCACGCVCVFPSFHFCFVVFLFFNQKSTCFEHCTDISFLHAYQRPIACRMGTGIRWTRPCVLWCLTTTMKMPQRRVANACPASQGLTSMTLGTSISQRSGFESGAGLPSATSASIGGGSPK